MKPIAHIGGILRRNRAFVATLIIGVGILWSAIFATPIAEWRWLMWKFARTRPPPIETMEDLRRESPCIWAAARWWKMDFFSGSWCQGPFTAIRLGCQHEVGLGLIVTGCGILIVPRRNKAWRISLHLLACALVISGFYVGYWRFLLMH